MGKYVIKKVDSGIRFDLKASNGEIIANSEVYTTKSACLKGIASVTKNAPIADNITMCLLLLKNLFCQFTVSYMIYSMVRYIFKS